MGDCGTRLLRRLTLQELVAKSQLSLRLVVILLR
jgi:hypothetical protein